MVEVPVSVWRGVAPAEELSRTVKPPGSAGFAGPAAVDTLLMHGADVAAGTHPGSAQW